MRIGRALPWLAIPVVVVPFLLWLVPSWWERLDGYGWFRYAMALWAVAWCAVFAWWVVAPAIERRYYERLGERVIRRSGTSAPDS